MHIKNTLNKTLLEEIFKEYDIRWDNSKIKEEHIIIIGYAILKLFKDVKSVHIIHDTRPNSEKIAKILSRVIGSGKKVYFSGEATTPMQHYLSHKYKDSLILMVTASHLDYKYNGIKFSYKGEVIGYKEGLYKLKKFISKVGEIDVKFGKYIPNNREKKLYLSFIRKIVNRTLGRKVGKKIIVDYGNSTSTIYGKILEEKGIRGINKKILKVPKRKPNPSEDLKYYKELKKRFEYVIAFDSDSDRAILIDNKGKEIMPDIVSIGILKTWKKVHGKYPEKIVIDETCSKNLESFCKRKGIKIYRSKVGRSNIVKVMEKYRADFGVERSGHYYFKEFFRRDSGVIAATYIIKAIELGLIDEKEIEYKYNKQYNFKAKKSFDKVERSVIEKFGKNAKKLRRKDGITIELEKSWFNIRKSNTSNIIRFTLESKDRKEFYRIAKEVRELLK